MKSPSFDQLIRLLRIIKGKIYLKFTFFLISTGVLLLSPSVADVVLYVFQNVFQSMESNCPNSSKAGFDATFFTALVLIGIGIFNFYYYFSKEQLPRINLDKNFQNWSIKVMWENARKLPSDVESALPSDVFNAINLLNLTSDAYSNSAEVFSREYGDDYIFLFEQLNGSEYKFRLDGKDEIARDLLFHQSIVFYKKLQIFQINSSGLL